MIGFILAAAITVFEGRGSRPVDPPPTPPTPPNIVFSFANSKGYRPSVTLYPDGRVEIDPRLTLDDAAKQFWNAVERARGLPPIFPEVQR